MSTGTEHTVRTIDNASLADALVSLAGLLRTHPEIPNLYSATLTRPGYRSSAGWKISVFPGAVEDEDAIEAVRTAAGVFPDSELHLSDPIADSFGGTYRRLEAHATHAGNPITIWEHNRATPAQP